MKRFNVTIIPTNDDYNVVAMVNEWGISAIVVTKYTTIEELSKKIEDYLKKQQAEQMLEKQAAYMADTRPPQGIYSGASPGRVQDSYTTPPTPSVNRVELDTNDEIPF